MDAPLNPARLGALNFGIALVWGALLAVSLQARCIELTPNGSGITAYALLASVGATLAALAQIAFGCLADRRHVRIGHRREFYWSAIVAIPILYWFFLAPTLAQLMASFFILQIVMNVAGGPYQAAIPDYAPAQRQGELSSWMSGYQSLGSAAGLLVAGFIHAPIAVASVLGTGMAASFAATIAHLRTLPARAGSLEPLRASGSLLTLLLSRATINLGFYTLLGFLLFFVRDSLGVHGLDAQRTQTALIFLSFTLAAIAGAAIAARPSDRYDKRAVISAATGVIVVALALLSSAQNVSTAYAAAVVAGVAWGAFATADWALACIVLPRGAMAVAMGIWNIANTVPQIIAPLVGARIILSFDRVQPGLGPRAAIVFSLLAFAVGTALIWRLPARALAERA